MVVVRIARSLRSSTAYAAGSCVAARTWALPVFRTTGQVFQNEFLLSQARSFRLTAEAVDPSGIRVLMVRHGQSTNNVLQLEVEERMSRGDVSAEEATQIWMTDRVHDPALSEKGMREADGAARGVLAATGGTGQVVASPMLRALQTAEPIARALASSCVVSPLVFEVGGMYRKDLDGRFVHAPGLSATEITGRFASFDASRLPQEGCWNGSTAGKETDAEIAARVQAAAKWVKSEEAWALAQEGRKPLVLVMHSDFIDFLLKALLAIPGDTRGYFANSNCSLTEVWLPRALCTSGEGAATLHYLNRIEHL